MTASKQTGESILISKGQKTQRVAFTRINRIQLLTILAGTFLIYTSTLNKEFIYFDDDWYIYNNPYLHPFQLSNIWKIFSEFYENQYSPLPTIFLGVITILAGDDPFLFNLSAIILHLINVALVCWLIYCLFKKPDIALITAALFAACPLHVESVAWASAVFKTGFYSIFFLSSLIAYVHYLTAKRKVYLAVTYGLFILSFLSKEQAAALVLSLLCIDFLKGRKLLDKQMVFEKIPFLILSLLFGIVTLMAAGSQSESLSYTHYNFGERILYACYALGEYVVKLFVPYQLTLYYPYPDSKNFSLWFYLHPVFIGFLIFLLVTSRRKNPFISFGILFFIVNLLFTLVLQVVSVRGAVMADRYVYVSSIGIYFVAAAGISILQLKNKWVAIGLLSILLCTFSAITFSRGFVWKNSLTLWNDVIDNFKTVPIAYNNRGVYFMNTKKYGEAIHDFNNAIKLNPTYPEAYYNRGIVLAAEMKHAEALNDFNVAINLKPGNGEWHYNRGMSLVSEKKYNEALLDYDYAIRLKPNHARAYFSRGFIYALEKKYIEALEDFNKAIALRPDYAEAYNSRGNIFNRTGKFEEASNDYTKAIELNAAYAEAYNNRGSLKMNEKKYDEALRDYGKAIELNAENSEAYFNRGVLFMTLNKYTEAEDNLNRAIRLNPAYADAYYNLGIIFYDRKNFERAIENHSQVIKLRPDYAMAYFNRGLAMFYSGKRDLACSDMKEANRLGYQPAADVVRQICP